MRVKISRTIGNVLIVFAGMAQYSWAYSIVYGGRNYNLLCMPQPHPQGMLTYCINKYSWQ